MPVKASYLLVISGGAIMAYSAVKGKGLGSSFRSVISGQPISSAVAANPITSVAASAYGYGTGGVPIPTGPPGPGETAWFTTLCMSLAAPPVPANLSSLHNWRTRECTWDANPPDGAQYTHNPLNTTLHTSASVGTVNSVGVQRYATAADGITATAQTLLGRYPHIVGALRRGSGLSTGDPGVSQELLKWSGGGYSSVLPVILIPALA